MRQTLNASAIEKYAADQERGAAIFLLRLLQPSANLTQEIRRSASIN